MQRNLGIPRNHVIRKKVRGAKRKLRSLERGLDSILLRLPEESLPHGKSWRYHLASPAKLVDSADSSFKLRKKFLQLLADRLVELDGSLKGGYRAFLLLSFPFLSHSRIEVCVDKEHLERLVNNAESPSTWTATGPERDLIKDLDIALPAHYGAKGYSRLSPDSKTRIVEENWFIWKAGK
jgi:hypothetical protein